MRQLTADALTRTLLLMRDDLRSEVSQEELLVALTETTVVLVADEGNLASHSAQCAFATAAMLMARSGHRVHLLAPDIRLLEAQPPLLGDRLVSALVAASDNLVPGVWFHAWSPTVAPDIEVRFGDSPSKVRAKLSIALNASAWEGAIAQSAARWNESDWPLGGLAASALAAGEAFKVSMRKLADHALDPAAFETRFAPCSKAKMALAPDGTPRISDCEEFDVVSGGAIANSFLFSLLRIRGATGRGRVYDRDTGDISNLNRNALMQYSNIGHAKVAFLANWFGDGLSLDPQPIRFEKDAAGLLVPTSRVIVGVDHIPTRWVVQEANPRWLGIGATSHWSAMASYHSPGLACARCLHRDDDPDDAPIPTVAFASFWAGLLLTSYFAQSLANRQGGWPQQTYLTPLRPELPWRTSVARRSDCPLCATPMAKLIGVS